MPAGEYDLVIRGAHVADAGGAGDGDLAIRDGRVAAVGRGLGPGREEIDARGKLVLPGGVDTHCHIEQLSGAGVMNADTFETATRSALYGGTTTTVSFAAQHPGMRIADVVADYAELARRGAMCDHAFHMIVADTSGDNLDDVARLIEEGHRSIKVFTTYDKVRLDDAAILQVLRVARAHGALVCFHAENDAIIRDATARLLAEGRTAPRDHAASHPRMAEIEALERICRFAEYTGQPVMLFHVSTREGVEIVRAARARGAPVWAETCTHYLFQTVDTLDRPDGAAFMCSPPQREAADVEALWHALDQRDLQLVTSDHAPYRMDESGKFLHGRDAPFNKIANGMPGLELRLPVLFDAMVSRGRLGLAAFVELTSAAPARLFGLTGKGALRPGMDADVVLWDPEREVTYAADDLHDNVGYNPFAGHTVKGWPETVLLRGRVAVDGGTLHVEPGQGRRVPMEKSPAMAAEKP
ncbi:dihydropyrimidinase [Tranquillimonas alkanivorans]|uniref:Dihydropyrimidinase n=1 Tax=Tranquillimonas alkanivorans TaxID=441119 RepID=A0A1I5RXQ6_9RHOB|nr:dihydropyrimidinase [Tranquillimonas alkanivorans]SFP63309.1 dihydropyrimidinase [Tranquillimonas alkanivorans]